MASEQPACRYRVNLDGTPGAVSRPGEVRGVLCAHGHGSRYSVQQCAGSDFSIGADKALNTITSPCAPHQAGTR